MAEEKNPEQNEELTEAERAQFEQDVLKAAEEAIKAEEALKKMDEKQNLDEKQEKKEEKAPESDGASTGETESEAPSADASADSASSSTDTAIDVLKAELAAANDRNLRLIAEFDNFRRRSAKEQLDLIETANGKLLEKLSEVQDNFERAFAAENKAKDLEAFEKGMQMIYNQFAKVLTDAGLEQIDPTGKEFDPNCHEALMQQPSETIPEGHVVTVFQKGYKLKNKILKTAKVIVSSGK